MQAAITLFSRASSTLSKTGSLYTLYALYETQPNFPLMKVRYLLSYFDLNLKFFRGKLKLDLWCFFFYSFKTHLRDRLLCDCTYFQVSAYLFKIATEKYLSI